MADESFSTVLLLSLLLQIYFQRRKILAQNVKHKRKRILRLHYLRTLVALRQDRSRKRMVFSSLLSTLISSLDLFVDRSIWTIAREDSWWTYTSTCLWTDKDWLDNLRLSKDTFFFLCDALSPMIKKKDTNFRKAISVDKRVALTLWRLATNIEFRSLAHLFGVGRSTACTIVRQVCYAIVEVLGGRVIVFPKGDEVNDAVKGFLTRWKIPQCVGAIDGSHIPIVKPSDHGADYYNRKGFYSVILQAVVSYDYRFLNVYPGWPGSVHDARVFSNSQLYCKGGDGSLFHGCSSKEIDGVQIYPYLIGDPAYPLLTWLMKPYSDNGKLSALQHQFNYRLSSARMVVENAFGRLKGRWRSLQKRNDTSLKDITIHITACCVLHNLCESREEEFLAQWDDAEYDNDVLQSCNEMDGSNTGFPASASGETVRTSLMHWFQGN